MPIPERPSRNATASSWRTTTLSRRFARFANRALRRSRLARVALRVAVRLLAPRQRLGALGVVIDDRGRVLLAKHALRARTPWGLPGGFVERGEHPAEALAREFQEELRFRVEVGELLSCVDDSADPRHDGPSGLTLVYACRLASAPTPEGGDAVPVASWELLDARWVPLGEVDDLVRGYEAEAAHTAAGLPSSA